MKNNVLRNDVLNGEKAIFKVTNENEDFIRYDILDYDDMLDLLVESNGDRLLDLAQLYNYAKLNIDDEIYNIVCGDALIARLIEDTAINIQEDIEFSIDLEEEKYNKFERE